MFGALLFLLLVTLILETSGLEIILFLSQNEDSVNTKCKVELRAVLQQVVSLHWNKCWFVQKKKKACPFWILLVLTFYFLSLLKKCVPLDFRNLLAQLWGITGRLLRCALPADVLDLLMLQLGLLWDLCWAQTLGKGMGGWMKSSAHRNCLWPPTLLCGATALFLSLSAAFYWVKAWSKKVLLQGSPEGMLLLCLDSCLTVF